MSAWSPTPQMVQRAAAELASQEFYNPGWCKPGEPSFQHRSLYERRARLLLEAAMDGAAFRPSEPDSAPSGQEDARS